MMDDVKDYPPYLDYPKERKKQTNADRIRAMSDEELTEFLLNRDLAVLEKASKAAGFTYEVDREQCFVEVIDWLKQEVSPHDL